MITGVEILHRRNKTSTVCNRKSMDASLKTVAERIRMGDNECTVTIRVIEKYLLEETILWRIKIEEKG